MNCFISCLEKERFQERAIELVNGLTNSRSGETSDKKSTENEDVASPETFDSTLLVTPDANYMNPTRESRFYPPVQIGDGIGTPIDDHASMFPQIFSPLEVIFTFFLFHVENYLDFARMHPIRRWKTLILYFTITISFKTLSDIFK